MKISERKCEAILQLMLIIGLQWEKTKEDFIQKLLAGFDDKISVKLTTKETYERFNQKTTLINVLIVVLLTGGYLL